jgi:hypothetical protein
MSGKLSVKLLKAVGNSPLPETPMPLVIAVDTAKKKSAF